MFQPLPSGTSSTGSSVDPFTPGAGRTSPPPSDNDSPPKTLSFKPDPAVLKAAQERGKAARQAAAERAAAEEEEERKKELLKKEQQKKEDEEREVRPPVPKSRPSSPAF